METIVVVAVVWLLSAGLCAHLARGKGRSPMAWGVAGLVFSVLAVALILLLGPVEAPEARIAALDERRRALGIPDETWDEWHRATAGSPGSRARLIEARMTDWALEHRARERETAKRAGGSG